VKRGNSLGQNTIDTEDSYSGDSTHDSNEAIYV
jgi:hypothetical protein